MNIYYYLTITLIINNVFSPYYTKIFSIVYRNVRKGRQLGKLGCRVVFLKSLSMEWNSLYILISLLQLFCRLQSATLTLNLMQYHPTYCFLVLKCLLLVYLYVYTFYFLVDLVEKRLFMHLEKSFCLLEPSELRKSLCSQVNTILKKKSSYPPFHKTEIQCIYKLVL